MEMREDALADYLLAWLCSCGVTLSFFSLINTLLAWEESKPDMPRGEEYGRAVHVRGDLAAEVTDAGTQPRATVCLALHG